MIPTIVTLSGYALLVYVVALGLFAAGTSVTKRTVASYRRKRAQTILRDVARVETTPPAVAVDVTPPPVKVVVQPWLLAVGADADADTDPDTGADTDASDDGDGGGGRRRRSGSVGVGSVDAGADRV